MNFGALAVFAGSAALVAFAAATTRARPIAPVRRAAPSAISDGELAALLADPAGPREITLAPGVYHGDLVVRRPVVLRGAPGTVLEGSGTGTVVDIDADGAALEGVTVRGSGHRHTAEDAGIRATGHAVRIADVRVEDTLFGVSLHQCRACVVERVYVRGWDDETELRGDGIKLWESHDSVVRGARLERSRDLVVWYTRGVTLEDDVVHASRYGAHFMHADDATVRRCRFEGNVVGIFVMYSARLSVEGSVLAGARGAAGVGLGFKDSDAVRVRDSWLVGNTAGVYLDNTPRSPDQPVTFEGNVVALNDVALSVHGLEKGVAMRANDFHQNAVMIEVDGGGDALALDLEGNHFSDYEGYDLDGDGRGDVPYEVKALSSELTEEHPSIKLFHGTAVMALVDAVAHAVPVLSSRRLLVDRSPLTARPLVREPQARTP